MNVHSTSDGGRRGYHVMGSDSDEGSPERDATTPTLELNEEIFIKMKCNDPGITRVWVTFESEGVFAGGMNWAREDREVLGRNTYLKELHVTDFKVDEDSDSYESHKQQFEFFCEGLSLNRSIECLSIDNIENDAMVTIISPFIQHNDHLRSLTIRRCGKIWCDETIQSMALALSRRNKYSLRRFNFEGNDLDDYLMGELIGSLSGHTNLANLILKTNEIGHSGCHALSRMLENPMSKLKKLDMGSTQRLLEELNLKHNDIGDEAVTALKTALAKNSVLKTLHLDNNDSITDVGWDALSSIPEIENLSISNNHINDKAVTVMANTWAINSTLRNLNLRNNPLITPNGWHAVFGAFQNPDSPLEELDLSFNTIDDDAAEALANMLPHTSALRRLNLESNEIGNEGLSMLADAFAECTMLKSLNLGQNHFINPQGLIAFADVLQSPKLNLNELYLSGIIRHTNDDVAISFASALRNDRCLKHLDLGRAILRRGCASFSSILCNKTSIMRTYASNHTLEGICPVEHRSLLGDAGIYLQWNAHDNKFEVARRKILKHHFSAGDGYAIVFSEMETKVMPHGIAWIGMDNEGRTLLYNVLRIVPSLFDSEKAKE